MKGITTIAALPSGAGQAAHLAPEVGAVRTTPPEPHPFQGIVDAFAKLVVNQFVNDFIVSHPPITMRAQIADELKRTPSALGRWQQKCRAAVADEPGTEIQSLWQED